ncbi:class I SAM-dependent methyltransferase [Limibaculum sp. M0105]|uniref:Class I SAM-dependent methyltransferase n=1 Tax=Thermohalobaculum xanthum TaxID=2753746 RepID=A0A8J7M8I2_9RHOB|nr:class I SAM-dependent methyltransferase [Thermohalobaculum xanthum]MBK0399720.1 class I SAM-dependent methyltransferase [Thermohalobaculum xanthum]
MSGFSADWLDLRAPADLRARNTSLAQHLAAHFARHSHLRVLDLGAGSGNNMRATAPLLPAPQHWVLADADDVLLSRAARSLPGRVTAQCEITDLSVDATHLVRRVRPQLVTASAFFDLCGKDFIDRLADALTEARTVLYAVLSYDGREEWEPPSALDEAALAAFHADQRRDKGLGRALGPDAHGYLAQCLADRGFAVEEGRSDWDLAAPADAGLIEALAEGSAGAISDHLGPATAAAWLDAHRHARRVVIGHRDLLAFPPK